MNPISSLRSLLLKFFRRPALHRDLDDELLSHIQLRAEDLQRHYHLSRQEAERRARLEFGAPARFKEESVEALGGNFLDTTFADLRYAYRMLRKSPSFTAVAFLTLALGIGANVVVFGVLDALILRPLNVPDAKSLYGIERTQDKWGYESYPNYLDLRDRNRTFDGIAAYNISMAAMDTGEHPSSAWVYEVSGNYFDVLRIRPYLGRFIEPTDEHGPDSAPYVVLGYGYWHTQFHDDRSVIGRAVQLNKHPFTVIGVAPPNFTGTLLIFTPDFFVPIVNQGQLDGQSFLNSRGQRAVFETLGHLKPGVTKAQAIADLDSIGAALEKTYPNDNHDVSYGLGSPSFNGSLLGGPVTGFVTGLMLLAGLILLAACTNLGTLFAARAADRSRELALRLALGSSRARLLRQLFTEALLISIVGGAAGLWASVELLRAMSVWRPFPEFPFNVLPVTPNATVYLSALLLALAAGFLFGSVPVRQVLRTDPYVIVKSGSLIQIGKRITVRDILLAVQIAICAILVTSSFVAVRGLLRSMHTNFGFEPRNAILVHTELALSGYRGQAATTMQRRMIDAMQTIPGVAAIGLVGPYPPLHMGWAQTSVFSDQTTDFRPPSAITAPIFFGISPGYFAAAGTSVLSGRNITWADDEKSPRIALVNGEFARQIFNAGQAPATVIGRYFKLKDGSRVQVIGLVEDGKYTAVLTESPQPAMFFPILQEPSSESNLVIRSPRDTQQLAADVQSKLRSLDPGVPTFIQTWQTEMNGALFGPRMATFSLGILGFMGALLSVTGVFGMAAYSVSKRLRELGIRIALGAQRKDLLTAALARPFKLLVCGSAAGLVLGLLAARVLARIVYQATPRDPLVLFAVVLAMLFLGLLATWIPAQRALSIDPLLLIRDE
jgi:predicted permease